MPLICVTCGAANRDGARFCAACGGSLAEPCGSCGAELAPGAQFCDSCGASVAAREPPAAHAEETRKVVTVVFADLVGSTALQESLDPEAARRVMERFYEAMRAVLEAHGGSVQKFIGDAVVAVFGIPSVREDDALLAVRAAAAMLGALHELNLELDRSWGVRLQMRTGVNTGELVISEEGVLVGNTMNTAARLEQAAPAGEVLIGEATWRLVHRAVEVEPVEALELKGKADRVRAWRLVSAAVADRRRTSAVEVPLVGREAELGRLGEAFEGVLAARACRLVTVMGSPGVGKTRLAHEFGASVAEHARVVVGRCEPSGEGMTFLPLAEILRSVAGIGEAEPVETVRTKLLELTPADDPDRERLVERVAGVLGVVEPASAQETFWALRRVLESLASERPLVLVLDDLHWGQPMLLDLVEHLVEWVRDAPVLIVALARPELREAREALARGGRRATDVLELEPLDQDQSQELVGGLLGEVRVPAALSARILETTEGNPLFLGETVRMLIDEGFLRREGDVWVAAADVDTIEVPATIQALLAARIEHLGSDERSVVERAAVIGKQFYRGAVAELVSPPVRAGIDGHLEALRRKDMVEPEGTYWIDEPVYRFHHVLIRDAAYRSLLKEARAELHERFADWLEVKAGDLVGEHEEVIAFHLEQAHEYRCQLGPPDERGHALGVRAAERLHSAGRRALAREDLAAAANLLGRALARGAPDESQILWDLCEATLSAGNTSTAAALVARLDGGGGDDRERAARARVLEAQLANLTGAGEVAATAESAAAAAVSLGQLGDRAGEAKGWQVAAGAYVRLGQVGAVEEALDKALAAARAADDRRRTTAVLAGAPRAALWGPSPVVRASGRCLDVVRILRMTPGNRHVEAIALRCQAVLEAMRGRTEAAREILAAGRATLEELGLAFELHETAVHAGIVELLAGDPGPAAEHLRAARDGFGALGAAAGAAQASALLARALVEHGGFDEEAIEQTRLAEEHGGDDLKTTITWCSARAEALARNGDLDQALAFARRAVSLADPTDALADKADASMALARVLLAAGDEPEAREAARTAGEWYAAKGHAVGVEWAARLGGEGISSAVDALAGEEPVLGERPPERLYAEYKRHYNERDVERALELVAHDWVLTDHRAMGWEEVRGRAGLRATMESSLATSPDIQFGIDEVLACDDRAIALRVGYRGRAADGGGEFQSLVGYVAVLDDDGRNARTDQYEYDDDAAMIARYVELGGGLAALGDRPPERLWAEFARLFAARRIEPLLELCADDYELVDHRKVGWEYSGPGPDGERVESMWAGSVHLRIEVDEVLACDERVIALRVTQHGVAIEHSGGGKFTASVCVVTVVESGRAVRWDQYEPDEREAVLARYAELGGRRSTALGDRPPEQVWAELARRWAARDVDALLELYAEDWVMTDHRAIGWEQQRGRVQGRAVLESVFGSSPDIVLEIDEVIACDERVIAMRVAYRGHAADGSGYLEFPVGYVAVAVDGISISIDQYEYDDDAAMLRRYHELGGRPPALGDRPPERLLAQVTRCQAAGDLDALMELYQEDVVLTDHRRLSWEDAHGHDALRRVYEAGFWTLPDLWMQVDELLACDDRVIAHCYTLRARAADGGGETALSIGSVNTVEAGQWATIELYDPDDREAMLARYAELTGSGTQPPRPQAELLNDELVRRYGAHDLEALIALYDEHVSFVDHRKLGWEPLHGRAEAASFFHSGMEASADIRSELDEVLASDDRVIATRLTLRGVGAIGEGEFSIPLGQVTSFAAGQVLTVDFYEPDDREAMLARYAELRSASDHTPVLDALDGDLIAPDVLVRDRRGFPTSDTRGIEAYRRLIEPERRSTVLASNGDLVLARRDGDPPLLILGKLDSGRLIEAIVLHDEARAREWLVVLSLARRWAGAGADLEALMACLHPDGRLIDHRPLQLHGAADTTAIREFFIESGKLLRKPRATWEVLDVYPGVQVGAMTWSGTDRSTGGPVEWHTFNAIRVRDGLIEEIHSFADIEPARAKFEELSPQAAHAALASRYAESVNTRDWDALAKLFAGGFVAVNRETVELPPDQSLRVEIIDDDGSGVLAARQVSSGTSQGGPWETTIDCVVELRGGLIARSEMFTPDQRDELGARLEELRADWLEQRRSERWEAGFAEDASLIDRRPGGWGTLHGADAIGDRLGRSLTGDALARTDEAALLSLGEQRFGVAVLGRDGAVALVELFEAEAHARERFAALAEDPDGAANSRLGIAWLQALNRRELSAARVCMTDDMVVLDHRPVPTFASELQTADEYLVRVLSLWELSDDARWWLVDGIESAGSAANSTVLVAGHWNQGGGWAEIAFGMVTSRRGDRFERFEYYPLEALAERRARLRELSSQSE